MDDQSSVGTVDPVPTQPPEQEFQTRNDQLGQDRTPDNPPSRGVSQRRALEGKVAGPDQQEFVPTTGTTIDEILRAAYFVATSIDAPIVEVVNPHVINMHYPADGSLATIKVEARSGAWGGLAHKGTPEEDADRNAHYDEMKAAAETAPPPEEGAAQEAHDDAHAREEAKPQEPRSE
jgi:hypothetical protein